jgi:hypothetical protein
MLISRPSITHPFSQLARASIAIVLLAAFVGCTATDRTTHPSCTDPQITETATRMGAALSSVSVLAPDTIASREIRTAYSDLVTDSLMATWLAHPSSAPGRQLSSPWPSVIRIDSVRESGKGQCTLWGMVEYTSSAPTPTDSMLRSRVEMQLAFTDHWRISAMTSPAPSVVAESDVDSAVAVLRAYYDAIDKHDFAAAYMLWGDNGRSSGKSLEQFSAGFDSTASVTLEVGAPGRVEGAAGSRYIEIPVTVRARTTRGTAQQFVGTYTLRRVVVDGATEYPHGFPMFS